VKSTFSLFLSILFAVIILFSCKKKEQASEDTNAVEVGKNYGGGIIFYVDGSGNHGLIAAEADQNKHIRWYNGTFISTNTTANGIGKGQLNTSSIISLQGSGSYAASLCDQLELNGYTDWFLPSKAELNLLYQQKSQVGGFSEGYYWSSTEYDSTHAWNQYFPYGPQYYANKSDSAFVRAVRAF
jgi:hypothetical protein